MGAFSCTPEGAEFVIGVKLGSFALLSACAAGGSFLVLARKEPKKPLLGLGGLQSCKCRCPYVRTRTELAVDGLAPYVPEVSAGGWQPEFGEANPHRALRCCVGQYAACPDAQSAEQTRAPDAPTPQGAVVRRKHLRQTKQGTSRTPPPTEIAVVTEHCLEP
ncbi:MAG: hypothetical protein LBO63_03790 [Oscillospiraceae bacterium]|nr:hypothetical protein [Oscillospiraceae bacterium]